MAKIDISKIVYKNHLTKIEENILIYIINNIQIVKKIGVRGIAKKHYTSTSTIMNLSKKLGYSGFLDMYYNLFFTLKAKNIPQNNDVTNEYFGINVNELLSLIDIDNINKFVNLLEKNKHEIMYTCGQGFSIPIIEYINKKLLISGFRCILSDAYENYDVNAQNAKLLIVVSKSGETDFIINAAKLAKKNNIKIVSFTNQTNNTLASLSFINFKIYDKHVMDDRNKIPNSFYPNVLMLFEVIFSQYLKKAKTNPKNQK
ncbi:MurR/RpiR family transcriptional regulator [Clostridium guangxiense]|uniref:MurR/RpiR family transcriptional regulator n=1 Tax=Clostridium guangxiense TaxID=1662055 RepID=UPI001E372C15|nr:MurR/RpiR family transcriptional regulator [Clostridium guangxiense]MCD2345504.1 MurR/RpiR family transcriptional regulator [Clostridium guangxiense]